MIRKEHLYIITVLSLILGTWKGYVALFEKEINEPVQIFSCPVSSLPVADQEALESGIPIRNPRDLQQVIEDYLS